MNKKLKEVEHFEKYLEEEQLPEVERKRERWKKVKPILFIVIAALILTVPTYLWFTQAPPEALTDCGFNKNCFIRLADNCEPALYHQEEVGSLVRYEITRCQLGVSFEKIRRNRARRNKNLVWQQTNELPIHKRQVQYQLANSVRCSSEILLRQPKRSNLCLTSSPVSFVLIFIKMFKVIIFLPKIMLGHFPYHQENLKKIISLHH